jgi:signal transduction histidine kinase
MARRRLPALLRSTVLRLATGYAALFVASALVLAGYVYWATAGYMSRQTDQTIRVATDALLERYRSDGVVGLARAIDSRLIDESDEDEILLLADPQRRILAGNLESVPVVATAGPQWVDLEIAGRERTSSARALALPLPDGFQLLVGRVVQLRLDAQQLIVEALLWSVAVTAGLAILGGVAARRVLTRRLAGITRVAERIVEGDFSRRVPVTGAGDEFDRLAVDINAMLDRLHELMDGVRHVSNAIAHDLRTPLARLRSRVEAALAAADSPAAFRAAAETALAEIDQLVAIFDALLRIAEIEAGHRRAAFARIELAPLIEDVADLYQPLAEARGLRLETRDAPGAAIAGDRALLSQALANLVDNAIKYTPAGGHVTITAAPVAAGVELVVADTGPGIPEAERGRVTERFYRLESSRATPGSGLGLSLVVSVAKLHGGRLSLEDGAPGLIARLVLPAPGGTEVRE